jgi:ABC-type nitrate/sulfonate/bicarbonate transport system substrate-binding protein
MKSLTRWLLLTLPFTLLFAAACGGDDDNGSALDPANPTRVTLMLNWTPNAHHAGIYLARENGWYRDAGIDLEIVEPAEGGVEQVVGAGRAQFGISIQESVIPAREQGVPIVSIATILQHNDSSLVSLGSEGITRPRDLAGKRYGGYGGALETALVKKLTECDGGDPEQVRFVDVGNVDYLVGMEQNQYDFVWIFEGWDGIRYRDVQKDQVNTILFTDHLDCIPDWYTPLIITSEKLIADRPELVRAFTEVTARGYQVAITDPAAAAAALLKAAPELDKALVELSTAYYAQDRYMDRGREWGRQDEDIWVEFEEFLRTSGLTEKKVDVSSAYTNQFLPKK